MADESRHKCALITGVSGQDGAYLARLLIGKGYRVVGTSRDSEASSFWRLSALGILDSLELTSVDLSDFRSVLQCLSKFEPDEVYNLAGQSSVGRSFEEPVETLRSIATANLNILEAIRFLRANVRLYNAGSSECFGDTGKLPANEGTSFYPRSPYAVAKAAAFWQVDNYREAYSIFACTGILFNHESPLRGDRFVTRKIIKAACDIASGSTELLRLGNVSISRDWGWAPEYVEAMWLMLQTDFPQDFVIATGVTTSLESFTRLAFEACGLDWNDWVTVDEEFMRPTDLLEGHADPSRALQVLGWRAKVGVPEIIERMVAVQLGDIDLKDA